MMAVTARISEGFFEEGMEDEERRIKSKGES